MIGDAAERRKLTVIVLSFNVEDQIEACLTSVRWADEVLVVDSFSTDRTSQLAASLADRVLQHEYLNYAAQHNWAIPQAAHEWILIVDSDEQVSRELQDEIQLLLCRPPEKEADVQQCIFLAIYQPQQRQRCDPEQQTDQQPSHTIILIHKRERLYDTPEGLCLANHES